MKSVVFFLAAGCLACITASRVFAVDSDAGETEGSGLADAAMNDDSGSGTSDEPPLACDGALCATDTGGTSCSIAGGVGANTVHPLLTAAVLLVAAGLATLRRHTRRHRRACAMKTIFARLLPAIVCVAALMAERSAGAQSQPADLQPAAATEPASGPGDVASGPVDVVIPEPLQPRRRLIIEWNPLPFVAMHTGVRPSDPGRPPQGGLGKLSANVVFAPLEHHAVIVSPFYVLTRTTPISIFDDELNATRLPIQTFRGFGTELGYRYYTAGGGLRGIFVGPSLILGAFTATAENGDKKSYLNYGVAVDFGYQALVLDRLALSLGVGLQYTTSSKSIPEQMLWAKVFANSVLYPRVLASIGWAL